MKFTEKQKSMTKLGRRLSLLVSAVKRIRETARNASSPHFVNEYTALVKSLIEKHPLDEAMSLAVGGGDYDDIGMLLTEIVKACGITGDEHLVDLGCGSGRLAKHLGIAFPQLDYFGIDVVQELIDYAATKGAIHAFTKSLAQNLVEKRIRVNCVAPGPIWTPLNVADKEAKKAAEHGKKTPMQRPGQPEEVAPAYVFFASNADSSYITGEVLALLGGETTAA